MRELFSILSDSWVSLRGLRVLLVSYVKSCCGIIQNVCILLQRCFFSRNIVDDWVGKLLACKVDNNDDSLELQLDAPQSSTIERLNISGASLYSLCHYLRIC